MNKVEINKEFYNKLYRRRFPLWSILHSLISFDQQSKSKINFNVLKEYFHHKFNDDLVILDYGFGHGSLLLKYRSNHKLYGCDISEEAVHNFPRVAKLIGKVVVTSTVDVFFPKYQNFKFDIITLSHIIEHVEDDRLLVKNLSEKLSNTGVILINVPINEVWQDPKHVRKYNIAYMEKLMNMCGLSILTFLETDKLTSFFLIEEKVKMAIPIKLYFIKIIRVIFAITPLRVTRVFEKLFLKGHSNQQLIILATKK
jgi:2-polyprenyl-3-methyl-5-hydroxy-6-metoxy-1,4-benzoquinol methylase